VPEPLLLLPFFLVTIGGNAMTAMASIADGLLRTAPAVQEESDFLRSVRVQPCIRPLNAAVWLLALM
jgi:hypothetical protein